MTQILGGIGLSDGGGDPLPAGLITGTLTPTRIPYASGATVLTDSAALVWNATPETLEILHVAGALDAPETNEKPQLHLGGDFDGVASGIGTFYVDGYGAQGNITMRRANGTQASKSAVGASGIVFNFRSYAYDGSEYGVGGLLRMIANGAQTGSNHGQDFVVLLTATGSVASPAEVFRVRNNPSGTVGINFASPGAALEVRGTPADIGYLIKARPTSTGSAYLQCSANGAANQAGFSYNQLSNSREWRNAIIGNDGDALRWGGGTGGTDIKMYLTQEGNLIINDTRSDPTAGTKMLILGDGTAPSAMGNNSCGVYGDDVSGTVNLFTMNEAGDINQLSGDIKIAAGKNFYTREATFMLRGQTAYTNGAGALTGTLTNSPRTGNPTKWIAIDDNGTTRHIPAW